MGPLVAVFEEHEEGIGVLTSVPLLATPTEEATHLSMTTHKISQGQ